MDNAQIKADFKELYRRLEGMDLREMDQILDPVCILCRDHERAGFVEGMRVGVFLVQELMNNDEGGAFSPPLRIF